MSGCQDPLADPLGDPPGSSCESGNGSLGPGAHPLVSQPDDPGCIETHGHGCLSREAFENVRDEMARDLLATPEFQRPGQWSLEKAGVHEAHATLSLLQGPDVLPGVGTSVALIDTGIDLHHPVFREGDRDGRIRETFPGDALDETGAEEGGSHGTAVASVLAGRLPGLYVGVAPGTDLEVVAADIGSPAEDWTLVHEDVLVFDPDVVNSSFTTKALIEHYDEASLRGNFRESIELLAQPYESDQSILVWAAGNYHGSACVPDTPNCVGDDHPKLPGRGVYDASSPGAPSALPVFIEELRGHSVAVVALGEDGTIADFSNRCGVAAKWCIAAPGEGVQAAYFGPFEGDVVRGLMTDSGTSFAAPMVSGALALMKQRFGDRLSNTELVARLFETADKSGVYADQDTYGQGVLDLGAALAPLGDVKIRTKGRGLRATGRQPDSASCVEDSPVKSRESGPHAGAGEPDGPVAQAVSPATAAAGLPGRVARVDWGKRCRLRYRQGPRPGLPGSRRPWASRQASPASCAGASRPGLCICIALWPHCVIDLIRFPVTRSGQGRVSRPRSLPAPCSGTPGRPGASSAAPEGSASGGPTRRPGSGPCE